MTQLVIGSSRTISVGDNGTVTLATNGGLCSYAGTTGLGESLSRNLGPEPVRHVIGPVKEGFTVTITNTSVNWLDIDALPLDLSLVSGGGNSMLGYSIGLQTKTDIDALESGALFTLDIPANTLGPNSVLLIVTHWTLSTTATWNLRARFGGAVLDNVNITGNASLVRWFEMTNVNSRSLQETTPISSSSVGTFSAAALGAAAVDFASAQQLTITAQAVAAGTGSLSAILKKVRVQHFYGA